jgi:hypothetical protein
LLRAWCCLLVGWLLIADRAPRTAAAR